MFPSVYEAAGLWLAGQSVPLIPVISVPKLGVSAALFYFPLLALSMLSTYTVYSLFFSGAPQLSRPQSPRDRPVTCLLYLNTSYLLPPPSQALQRCSVLPAASGHPSGPVPEGGEAMAKSGQGPLFPEPGPDPISLSFFFFF